MTSRFGLPDLGVGVGLRTTYYAHILEHQPDVAWFETVSENFMQAAGRRRFVLDRVAAQYPIAMHGVSLSIGSTDPLDLEYLGELRSLRDAIGAVQDFLGAPIALENPSTYAEFVGGSMTEWDFLAAVASEADCGILLDVNNIYVNAFNHSFDVQEYLDAVPFDRVVQLHVAGHTRRATHIVDTHIGPVESSVWDLLGEAWDRAGGVSVLLGWDAEIPPFEEVHAEALRANDAIERARRASPSREAASCAP